MYHIIGNLVIGFLSLLCQEGTRNDSGNLYTPEQLREEVDPLLAIGGRTKIHQVGNFATKTRASLELKK